MKNLSLRAKLLTVAVTFILFSIISGAIGSFATTKVANSYSKINTEILPVLDHLDLINNNINLARINIMSLSRGGESDQEILDIYIKKIEENWSLFHVSFKELSKLSSPEERKIIENIRKSSTNLEKNFTESIALLRKAKGQDGPDMKNMKRIVDEDILLNANELTDGLNALKKFESKKSDSASIEANSAKKMGINLVMIINLISLGVGGGLTFFITRDLLKSFRGIGAALNNSSQEVGTVSSHVATSSEELLQASTEQASALEQTAASVEETSAMVKKNAEGSVQAADLSKRSEQSALHGQEVVGEMIAAINEINVSNNNIMNQVNESNKRMQEIVHVIQEIENKTKVINDIVFQTKLLSFNASVEAARAGEHGKGFAVVAEEVGNLAQMSGNASNEISAMLAESVSNVESIVEETKTSVEKLIEEGKNKVAIGTKVANECGVVLNDIVANISQVTIMSNEISMASDEQSRGVAEVSKAMGRLDHMTQQNASAARSSSQLAEELSRQSETMKELVQDLLVTIEGKKLG